MNELLLGIFAVFTAYFLKGFSGFGPALVMIPLFSLVYDPATAIILATLLDLIGGTFLTYTVRRDIDWKFVLQIFTMLAAGAIFGSLLLGTIDLTLLKRIIGGTIIAFSLLIFLESGLERKPSVKKHNLWRFPIGLFSGFLGGLLGITGPPLVIYMKLLFNKTYFRTQLIAIFFLGTGWRLLLYRLNNIEMHLDTSALIIYIAVMFAGLWIGSHLHLKVNERLFNRVVASLLIIPAVNLLLF